jgi:hypothetical protein
LSTSLFLSLSVCTLTRCHYSYRFIHPSFLLLQVRETAGSKQLVAFIVQVDEVAPREREGGGDDGSNGGNGGNGGHEKRVCEGGNNETKVGEAEEPQPVTQPAQAGGVGGRGGGGAGQTKINTTATVTGSLLSPGVHKSIMDAISERLAHYMLPARIYLVSNIPVSTR